MWNRIASPARRTFERSWTSLLLIALVTLVTALLVLPDSVQAKKGKSKKKDEKFEKIQTQEEANSSSQQPNLGIEPEPTSPVDSTNPALLAGLKGGGGGGKCNVPTDGSASPLFGAKPFTQQLLREEMFGTRPLEQDVSKYTKPATAFSLPVPPDAFSTVDAGELDALLAQELFPYPTRDCNDTEANPWQQVIESHTGPLQKLPGNSLTTYCDGRPSGPQYGHQRYEEFYPQRYFESAQAGSRVNGGVRDNFQLHKYGLEPLDLPDGFDPQKHGSLTTYNGEFAPGGLYHNTVHGIDAFETCRSKTIEASCTESSPEESNDGEMCVWDNGKCKGIFDGTTTGIPIKFHPRMPEQDHQALWTFDGTLPPKLLMGRYGEGLLFRHHNALPVKFEANRGFGHHFITTHRHNGHQPAESDGYASSYFLPGQFWDYHWPMVMAGYDTINTDRSDPKASMPCFPGEKVRISYPGTKKLPSGYPDVSDYQFGTVMCPDQEAEDNDPTGHTKKGLVNLSGDYREIMSTHWFHDHMLDFTSQNVYKGNAAMFNMYSGIDRANECTDDGINMRFPSGCDCLGDFSWGNRDYDVNLIVATKAWGQDTASYTGTTVDDTEGQLWFATFNTDGFVGDVLTANLLYKPFMNVRARRYRYRILDADVSRFLRIAIVVKRMNEDGEFAGEEAGTSYDRVPFHAIANDGNIMEHAVPFDGSMDLDNDGDLEEHNGVLPTQAIAERFDIIVDFSEMNNYGDPNSLFNQNGGISVHDRLYMVNLLEHRNGKRPHRMIPLAEALSGLYDCDGGAGKFLEMRVKACTKAGTEDPDNPWLGGEEVASCHLPEALQRDRSMDPGDYVPGESKMLPMPYISEEELEAARHRTFVFGRGASTDESPVTNDLSKQAGPIPSQGPITGGLKQSEFVEVTNLHSVSEVEVEQLPLHVDKPWGIKTDDGAMYSAAHKLAVASASPKIGDLEIWHIINGGGGWSHNVHVHFEEGRILTRDNEPPPEWEKWARKDVYRVGRMDDSGSEVTFAIRFREFAGSYMEHCHNTVHEDNAMLLRWDIENPGQLKPFMTPVPQWNGCIYQESGELFSARAQDENGLDRDDSEVGNPKAKKRFFKKLSAAEALCPAGANTDCVGEK